MVRIVKNAAERREEIVAAACRLFLSKGYDKTTMQEVMHEVQVAKGTIYHYFKSKEELLEAAISSIVKEEINQLQQVMENSRGSALDKIEQLALAGIDSHDQELLDHLHQPGNAGMHIRLLAALITKQAPLYAELIRQGCEEGIFETETPLECAEFILAATQFLTDEGIYQWTDEQLRRRGLALPGLVEAQLRAPEGSFQFLLALLQ